MKRRNGLHSSCLQLAYAVALGTRVRAAAIRFGSSLVEVDEPASQMAFTTLQTRHGGSSALHRNENRRLSHAKFGKPDTPPLPCAKNSTSGIADKKPSTFRKNSGVEVRACSLCGLEGTTTLTWVVR